MTFEIYFISLVSKYFFQFWNCGYGIIMNSEIRKRRRKVLLLFFWRSFIIKNCIQLEAWGLKNFKEILRKRFLLIHKENNWKSTEKTAKRNWNIIKKRLDEWRDLNSNRDEIKERIIVKQWVEWNMKLI